MNIVPHVLLRVAQFPFEILRKFEAPQCALIIKKIAQAKTQINALKPDISRQLHSLIAQSSSPSKNQILSIRRNIHNDRHISSGDLAAIEAVLSKEAQALLTEIMQLNSLVHSLSQEGAATFEEEFLNCRSSLVRYGSDPLLQKVILASSHAFYQQQARYLHQLPKALNKKTLRRESTLWQYINRMTTKTSPFSAATNLAMASLTAGSQDSNLITLPPEPSQVSTLRINNRYLRVFKEKLIEHPESRRGLSVRLNPSINPSKTGFQLLTSKKSREQIINLSSTATSRTVYKRLTHILSQSHMELCLHIAEHLVLPPAAAKEEVDALIEQGFLEIGKELSVIDPEWISNWSQILKPTASKSAQIQQTIQQLEQIEKIMNRYSRLEAKERHDSVLKCFQFFQDMVGLLQSDATCSPLERLLGSNGLQRIQAQLQSTLGRGPHQGTQDPVDTTYHLPKGLKPENLFFEDFYWSETPGLNWVQLEPVLELFYLYCTTLPRTWIDRKRVIAHDYLHTNFSDSESVPLLDFMQGLASTKKSKSTRRDIPANIADRKTWDQFRQATRKYLQGCKEISSEVNLSVGDLPQFNSIDPTPISVNAFVQFYYEHLEGAPALHLVVNNINPGFGKWFSRFLSHFDPKISDTFQKWNLALYPMDTIACEVYDVKTSNTGIHSPLLPYEICYPKSLNQIPQDQRISIANLEVQSDTECHGLKLIAASTQQEIKVYYLCFNSVPGQSDVFNLLTIFSDSRIFSQQTLINGSRQEFQSLSPAHELAEGNGISCYPRITIDKRIVIQRRQWKIPKRHLPLKRASESHWEYFLRINLWRLEHQLPADIFRQITTYTELRQLRKEDLTDLAADAHKPQFVSFDNPISVLQFARDLRKVPSELLITEMLPTRQHGIPRSGQTFACEFLFQLQSKAPKDE